MTKELDQLLRSREFNQKLGEALLKWAEDGKREAYERIAKAGAAEAIKEMAAWGSTGLPMVYVRDYLETIIDVNIRADHVDAMNEKEYDVWCERWDAYNKDQKKALIPRKGYQQWFLDKWFSQVAF